MNSLKSVISNKWFVLAVIILVAFLIFQAPRIAYSLPWI